MSEPEIVIRIPLRILTALHELIATLLPRPEMVQGATPAPAAEDRAESPADEREWSDAQRRLIYRLLQKLGYEGDAARNFITTTLRLSPGQPPGLKEASRLIDSLQEQVGPNGNGARRAAP